MCHRSLRLSRYDFRHFDRMAAFRTRFGAAGGAMAIEVTCGQEASWVVWTSVRRRIGGITAD